MILTLKPSRNICGCFCSESGGFSILSHSMQPKRQKAQLLWFADMSCLFTKSHQIGSLSLTERIRGQKRHVPALGLATLPSLVVREWGNIRPIAPVPPLKAFKTDGEGEVLLGRSKWGGAVAKQLWQCSAPWQAQGEPPGHELGKGWRWERIGKDSLS